ncbi:hypothetical protein [Fluviispira multicolorata]|uniref:Uncharacterized protein n=1 Tax=Fluviispira multicolorata TaxID=2654512 RepID=A0A833JFT8_9BACT|nr:hypothetical protein [Fluviispira multicolorata]KAB8033588.1 hypothetical protein GCL57_02450 [Fluviispira multicolorata]
MNNTSLLSLLKSLSYRFEEHKWTNTRGEIFQAALLFKPEQKEEVFSIIKNEFNDGYDKNENFTFFYLEKNQNKKQKFFYNGKDIYDRISLSKKKTYKSYIADLDAPVRERINYLRAELKKARDGKIIGRPPLLIEELLKQAEKRTLRQHIEENLDKLPIKEYKEFRIKIKNSNKCLVTDYLDAPEYIWANMKKNNNLIEYNRLQIGVNLFFSLDKNDRNNSKVSNLIKQAIKDNSIFKDYILYS